MLILKVRPYEQIKLADNVTVSVSKVEGDRVYLAIDAPSDCPVDRSHIRESKVMSMSHTPGDLVFQPK